jgi:hypothetical protein
MQGCAMRQAIAYAADSPGTEVVVYMEPEKTDILRLGMFVCVCVGGVCVCV